MNALRVGALFVAYGAVGGGGEYVSGLLLGDWLPAHRGEPVVLEAVTAAEAAVEVSPEVVIEARVRKGVGSRDCGFSEIRSLTLSADGVTGLSIDAGAGELRVAGEDGLTEVVVSAVSCASDGAWLDELGVRVSERGSSVAIEAHYPGNTDRSGVSGTARVDLDVRIPAGLDVSIDDTSGDVVVSGTGNLRIDDSSGSIDVAGIAGSVSIDDTSDRVDLVDVAGDVRLDDGSGAIDVRRIAGSILLRDGSGGIEIAEVAQSVLIESDGSGSIDVRGVGGDFVVESDGSGSIECSDVRGDVIVPGAADTEDRRRRRHPCR